MDRGQNTMARKLCHGGRGSVTLPSPGWYELFEDARLSRQGSAFSYLKGSAPYFFHLAGCTSSGRTPITGLATPGRPPPLARLLRTRGPTPPPPAAASLLTRLEETRLPSPQHPQPFFSSIIECKVTLETLQVRYPHFLSRKPGHRGLRSLARVVPREDAPCTGWRCRKWSPSQRTV